MKNIFSYDNDVISVGKQRFYSKITIKSRWYPSRWTLGGQEWYFLLCFDEKYIFSRLWPHNCKKIAILSWNRWFTCLWRHNCGKICFLWKINKIYHFWPFSGHLVGNQSNYQLQDSFWWFEAEIAILLQLWRHNRGKIYFSSKHNKKYHSWPPSGHLERYQRDFMAILR